MLHITFDMINKVQRSFSRNSHCLFEPFLRTIIPEFTPPSRVSFIRTKRALLLKQQSTLRSCRSKTSFCNCSRLILFCIQIAGKNFLFASMLHGTKVPHFHNGLVLFFWCKSAGSPFKSNCRVEPLPRLKRFGTVRYWHDL